MSTQPEALRLAEQLETEWGDDCELDAAAAELRRLNAQNTEMREALRWIADRCPVHLSDYPLHQIHKEIAHDAGCCARAAIAKAEGQA